MSTLTGNEQLIAVSGATGQQGGELHVPCRPAANSRCVLRAVTQTSIATSPSKSSKPI